MVKLLSIFMLCALANAIPAPEFREPQVVHSNFFWENWVRDIEADPDTAASPEEAWASFNATIHARNLTEKRQSGVNCDVLTHRAKGPSCVKCINTLARRGANGKKCGVGVAGPTVGCKNAGCTISAQTSPTSRGKINCNALARAAGAVMDKCFRADQTVAGNAYAPAPNQWAYIHVQGG